MSAGERNHRGVQASGTARGGRNWRYIVLVNLMKHLSCTAGERNCLSYFDTMFNGVVVQWQRKTNLTENICSAKAQQCRQSAVARKNKSLSLSVIATRQRLGALLRQIAECLVEIGKVVVAQRSGRAYRLWRLTML